VLPPDVLPFLRCPVCRESLGAAGSAIRCATGHTFDVARHGYVSFLGGRGTALQGDDARMVDARDRFLAAGHLAPLTVALSARAAGAPSGLVLEVGAGTAHHLARVLDALPGHPGLALDLSRHAARRAARAHPRLAAVVADARGRLPLADRCVALALDVFAPRNGPELARVLRDDGRLLVVTPRPEHLSELRSALGLLEIAPDKERRTEAALAPHLRVEDETAVAWTMRLDRAAALAVAEMGPAARHVDAAELARRAGRLPEPVEVTGAVRVSAWRRA
jgi:23S rRNA (guanine745-N1)-methyltransferase